MLELLSLLIFYKNKDTFDESKSFQKERQKKDEKKREREVTKMQSHWFLLNIFRILYTMVFEIFSGSFFIYFGQKNPKYKKIWSLPTPPALRNVVVT